MRTPAQSIQHHRLIHLLSFLIGSCIIVVDALEIVTNRSDLPAKCPPLQCGDEGVLIEYPFIPPMGLLGRNFSNYYCGYPDISISYNGDMLMFNTSANIYVVKAIDYTKRTMSLIDVEVLYDPKVNHPLNIISYTNILDLSPSDVQLEFFFDCTPQQQFVSNLVACLSNNTGKGASYVFLVNDSVNNRIRSNLSKDCVGGSVTSNMLLEQWNGIKGDVSRFGRVLQQGFELTWNKTIYGNCAGCNISNGSCGYVNDTGLMDFKCYCKDGRIASTDCWCK